MMRCVYVFVPLFVVLALHFSFSEANVQKECKAASGGDTAKYSFCVSALKSVPGADAADVAKLAAIASDLCLSSAATAESKAKDSESKAAGAAARRALEDCLELYGEVVDRTRAAAGAIKGRKYEDANVELSGALTSAGTCQEGFDELGLTSPVEAENKKLQGLLSLCLSFVAELEKGVH